MLSWVFILTSIVVFSQHAKNVLIYNLTSTGCGPCSCMDSTFKHIVMPAYPNTIIVALHSKDSDFGEYPGICIRDFFHDTSQIEPSCFPDGLGYDVNNLSIKDSLKSIYERHPETPIFIKVANRYFDTESRWVDLDISIRNDGPELYGKYRYNVMLTEDNVLGWHMTWPRCSTPNTPLGYDTTYLNSAVTRNIIYCANGAPVSDGNWPEQYEIQFTTKIHLNPEWIPENCHVIVNVYKAADSLYQSPVLQAIREPIIESSATPENHRENNVLKVYPNPASGISNLHFALNDASSCSLNIYDLKGNLVQQIIQRQMPAGKYNVELNTTELVPGTYLIVLETEQGRASKKMIVL